MQKFNLIMKIQVISDNSRPILIFQTNILTGYLPMSQKVGETQNRQFSRNLCHSTLSWSKLTTQNIFDL